MNETPRPPRERNPVLLFALLGTAAVLMVVLGVALLLFLKPRNGAANVPLTQPVAADVPTKISEPQELAPTNSVTIRLGEDEAGQGLILNETERDGRTTIESIDGVLARVMKLPDNRVEMYCYFLFDPAFKQEDVRRARIDVEYFDPEPGSLIIHYDALDAPDLRSRAYREATRPVRLTGSNIWQKATFYTRNDAAFSNRQNGRSDFRVCAKTPMLYLRRVTVTREAVVEESWPVDFSTSNQVSVLVGQEKPQDGLRHLPDVGDGRTVVTNLDGVPCRYLNRLGARSPWGSMYFEISPSFKRDGLANARIEVEYLTTRSNAFRVEFDGIENGRSRTYVPVLPTNANLTRWVTGVNYARAPVVGAWDVATFEITNATFRNSQNGGADFRFEVVPPEVYVRRVTVTRRKL
jgi:hypothetical protein